VVDDEVFAKVSLTGTETVADDVFTEAGHNLMHLVDTSAASLAFLVRICLHGPSMSSIGGIKSQSIGGNR
jgi:hypothetical protein